MRPRNLWFTAGLLAILAGAAIALISHPSEAFELAPPSADEAEPQAHGDVPEPEANTAGGAVAKSDVGLTDPVFHPVLGPDTTGWTTGRIIGDIPLVPTVLPRIKSISVIVDELRNVTDGTRNRIVVPVTLGNGTPTFVVDNVPFSDYGYVVTAFSPGLNGGQSTVKIDKDHPYADDVKLPITPGCPFSLRLRDQDMNPVAFTDVCLVPFGEPGSRPRQDGRTDNFGSVVFADVLAGEYDVYIGPAGRPLMTPPRVRVLPGAYLVQGSVVQPQGTLVTVPRGMPLDVVVVDVSGYPVPDARVRLLATDRTRLTEFVEQTDLHGKVQWPNVLAGQWEIEVTKLDHVPVQKQLTIVDGQAPPQQDFKLVRLR
jgi:hypothetical protein